MSEHDVMDEASVGQRVFIVMLDEDLWSAYVTFDEEDAEWAALRLAETLGHDRVSTAIRGQDERWMWETKLKAWAADPRINGKSAD